MEAVVRVVIEEEIETVVDYRVKAVVTKYGRHSILRNNLKEPS